MQDQRTHAFKVGLNPKTGGTAIRTLVYGVMSQFPQENLRIRDVAALLPDYSYQTISDAIRDLIHNPHEYPGIHRPELGIYRFDLSKPVTWVTFPNMKRKKRKKKTEVKPIELKAEVPISASFPAPTTPAAPSPGVHFVSSQPVFDAASGTFMPMTEARLLQDEDGVFWHARRI